MTKSIRVGIADDHDILRQTMAKLLQSEENISVVIEAAHGQELLDKMVDEPVDVVILDLNMPVMDGRSTLKSLGRIETARRPSVIILSMYDSPDHIRKYVSMGANAFLSKGCEYPALVRAIKDVHTNGYHFNQQVSRQLVSDIIRNSRKDSNLVIDSPLSERETEILRLICQQKTSQEISKILRISQRTVENHRLRISKKTGAKTSIGLLIYAMRNGLTDIESL
ncbi:MAG: response regulator transcription factor [bacterium]|nr:response regulator transcription factor [bacterium]